MLISAFAGRYPNDKYLYNIERQATAVPVEYPNGFRSVFRIKKLSDKNIGAAIAKKVAIFCLISLIGLASTLMVNAGFRDRLFRWVSETFSQFSLLGTENIGISLSQNDFEMLSLYAPQYIPPGFDLYNTFSADPMIIYDYINANEETIQFQGKLPTGTLSAYDTEGVEVEEIIFKDEPAFLWQRDGFTYFIWKRDGLEFGIVAQLNLQDIVKIAESVRKTK